MSKIKVVSFDADGTLVTPDFSQAVWYEGVPHLYAKKNGLSFHKAKEFIEKEYQVAGDCRVEWYDIKYWLQRFSLDDCHQQLLEDYSHTVSWYPDVKQALSSLSKNYTLIVVSCSTREFLPFLLDGIERYFARVFSSVSDYGQIKTPHFFLEVCHQMGVSPREISHIGDLWEQDFIIPEEAGIKAFHLDRRGERKDESSLRSLADLELRLRGCGGTLPMEESKTMKEPIKWLLEPNEIGVRYLAMRDLVKNDTKELMTLKKKAHEEGPISLVLTNMNREGYWERPGAGYNPKYKGTVWSLILLSQLGASVEMDKRIATACSYLLEHALTKDGQFSMNGLPSGTIDCLQGNLCAALLDLGCEDERINKAFEWMARSVTGEGVSSIGDKAATVRYYSGKCGPNFACSGNNKLPCAWGAVKVMLAFSKLPKDRRTNLINNAISAGVDFLFSKDPAKADYPCGFSNKPSGNWWKFGFPLFYVTDLLQNVEALVGLGYGNDPRLARALNIIHDKQDSLGRWLLEYDYEGKTWVDFGARKQPNKWVTLRALRVLKAVK